MSWEKHIPAVPVTQGLIKANPTCCVCRDPFTQGEESRRLECLHVFHGHCILPWLRKRATCPVCRHPVTQPRQPGAAPSMDMRNSRITITGSGHNFMVNINGLNRQILDIVSGENLVIEGMYMGQINRSVRVNGNITMNEPGENLVLRPTTMNRPGQIRNIPDKIIMNGPGQNLKIGPISLNMCHQTLEIGSNNSIMNGPNHNLLIISGRVMMNGPGQKLMIGPILINEPGQHLEIRPGRIAMNGPGNSVELGPFVINGHGGNVEIGSGPIMMNGPSPKLTIGPVTINRPGMNQKIEPIRIRPGQKLVIGSGSYTVIRPGRPSSSSILIHRSYRF